MWEVASEMFDMECVLWNMSGEMLHMRRNMRNLGCQMWGM